jgi:hypothetical protein
MLAGRAVPLTRGSDLMTPLAVAGSHIVCLAGIGFLRELQQMQRDAAGADERGIPRPAVGTVRVPSAGDEAVVPGGVS